MLKRNPIRMKKILAAANGETCTFNFVGCQGKHPSVVACHSNYHQHGKGMGQKADDIFVAFGCQNCHDIFDRRKPADPMEQIQDPNKYSEYLMMKFYEAMSKTWQKLILRGILK